MGIGNVTGQGSLNPAGKPVTNQSRKTETKQEPKANVLVDKKDLMSGAEELQIKSEAIDSGKNNPISSYDEALQTLQEAMVAMLNDGKTAEKSQVNLSPDQVLKLLEA
ncbi:MAG: hypothetical protein JEY94_13975 [Melioribacteraceae bacterium]|nr:hypothetical protein [Melioribacteraceae bacterium]